MRRRFFQRLQERVERLVGQHVHLVDDVHLHPQISGSEVNLLAQPPDVVNPPVGRSVDLQDVERPVGKDRFAGDTLIARLPLFGGEAVDRAGKDAGDRRLPDPAFPGEQVGVGGLTGDHGIFQRANYLVLADYIAKALRSKAAIKGNMV